MGIEIVSFIYTDSLKLIVKQFLTNYIYHSQHLIPDGIHYHEGIKEASIALGCQAPRSLLVPFLFTSIVSIMQLQIESENSHTQSGPSASELLLTL